MSCYFILKRLGNSYFNEFLNFAFGIPTSCCILFTDFRTAFVFALGPLVVNFYDLQNVQKSKVQSGFKGVEYKLWGHISVQNCSRIFVLSDAKSAFDVPLSQNLHSTP